MTIPTRRIEKPEFMELSKAEGDVITLFKLTNIPFAPPLPQGLTRPKVKRAQMNVLMMNVSEPVIYKDEDSKMVFIIMNGYDDDATFTWQNFQDCHLIKGEWGYRLAPSYWNEDDDDLDDAVYRFNNFHATEGDDYDSIRGKTDVRG